MWTLRKPSHQYILPAGSVITMLILGMVEDGEGAATSIVFYMIIGGFITASLFTAKREKSELILSKWWEKTGYVLSIGICALIGFFFVVGLVVGLTS